MFDLRIEGKLARLVLNRPEARNAIPAAGWSVLAGRLREAERSGARLLVLSGAGGAFCSGADLADFAAMRVDPAAVGAFRNGMRAMIDGLALLPIPTIAAVDGPCYGAGVAVAMACDLRVAAPGARFAITPAKLGISYPQEDVHRLVALTGPGQAARLLLSARSIDAAEALRIGLVDLVAGDRLDEEVDALAVVIAAHPGESLATLKRGIRLAAAGVRSDEEQDRRFDALIRDMEPPPALASGRAVGQSGKR